MPLPRHPAALTATLSMAAAVSPAVAQFTADAATPAPLASGPSEQVQPKVVPIPAGGFYMAWYDNRAGGYDPWVQRFDATGRPVWPGLGVQVLDTSFSSTEDYGLTIDAAGNAVMVTRADAGGLRIIAQAISPDGALLWGPTGVTVSSSSSVNAPKAGRTGDGAAVAGWTEGNRAKVLRLNADGTFAWAAPATVTDGTATTILSDLQPGDGGSVIASVVRYTTFTGAKTLQAQKFSEAGAPLWAATNTRVFSTGSLQFGNFPTFVPDGEGGAVFAWYTSSPLQCAVQWVAPNGTLRFGTNGATVTPTANIERVDPGVTVDTSRRQVHCAWAEHVPNSSIYGSAMQSFDEAGTRLLGNAGVALEPLATAYSVTQARAAMVGGAPTFTWTRSAAFAQDQAWAQSFDEAGNARWSAPVALSASSEIGRPTLVSMAGTPAWAAFVWQSGGSGASDVVGQRLNADGTLGPIAVVGDLNGDGLVNGQDLGILLGAWGPSAGSPADLDGDGVVNGQDLGVLLGNWSN
jgi:hypothetical protein